MKEQSIIHHTFVLERSYAVSPERVFAALSNPAQKRRWLVEGGRNDVVAFETEFRVGGKEKAVVRFGADTPFPGTLLTRDATYQDIVAANRVVMASAMTIGDKRISVSLETFELLATDKGTDLIFTHQAAFFEGADGPQMREDGWIKLLGKLAEELGR